MKKLYLSILLATALTTPQTLFCAPPATRPQTWTAQDALGRTIGSTEQYGAPRPGKTVGMFFVIWHGTSGYDTYMKQLPDEGVRIPQPTDTLSPYDNQKLMTENPQNPQYGPQWVFHHWGEPYLGYYLADDDWVIRKHAQMLTDAGVDVIIVDLTNAVIYLPQLKNLCKVYTQIREAGGRTPQLSFIFNTQARETVQRLYDNFYAKGLYKDLWFYWKGKPLILCPPQDVTPQFADFFTIRHSWFCSLPEWEWFGDGRDKWPWADYYPQNAGWHESPDKPEAVSVAPATHPITDGGRVRRVGRSYHNGQQPDKAHQHSEQGLCFAEQFSRAMELDPEFVFFAGWNEWTAIRIIDHNDFLKCGDRDLKEGDTYFWDLYNHEYSRDIEPLRGRFGDNYYYQLCDFIRRYKGVEPITFNEDGSINEVEMTSQGAGDPLNAFDKTGAERACLLWGNTRIRLCAPDNEELSGIQNENYAVYKYLDFGDGADSFTVDVTPKAGGKIEVWIDNLWTPPVGVVDVPASDDGKPVTLTAKIQPVKGVHALTLRFTGDKDADELFTVDAFRFGKQ